MNRHQTLIASLTTLNPAGVEACIRTVHDDLDDLAHQHFAQECAIAAWAERDRPGYLQDCAEKMGLGNDYAVWEAQRERSRRHVVSLAREGRRNPARRLLHALVGA